MALNISVVNNTIINVYETDQVPRSYFGATGASGKFYPSGVYGGISAWEVMENTIDAADAQYDNVGCTTNGSGTNALWTVTVSGNTVSSITQAAVGSGYKVGDLVTIQGSDLDGGDGVYTIKITSIIPDGLLIVVGGDYYEVNWSNLIIGGTTPLSLSEAQSLLATLFSTL